MKRSPYLSAMTTDHDSGGEDLVALLSRPKRNDASGGGLTALCGDVFGNYVVQKLLEVGDDKMLEDIMQKPRYI